MARLWSTRDESRYMFLLRMELERGTPRKEAAEMAARAVSQQQREEGRYEPHSAGYTGNPNLTLEERTVAELRNIACNLNINVQRKMRKPELITAIRSRRMMGALPLPPRSRRPGAQSAEAAGRN